MKANVIYSNSPRKDKLSVGSVYKSQDSDITYIILKLVSMKGLTFEVLSVNEDGDITTFNLQSHEIANTLDFVGHVDTISVSVKVV